MGETGGVRRAALDELRNRLSDGRARAGLGMSELARRAGLGRTTVHSAFNYAEPAPSSNTLTALSKALRLPADELLALRRTALGEAVGVVAGERLGRLIGEWEPHSLEVRPAGTAAGQRVLPGYVRREHDQVLASAVQEACGGRSRLVVLVGDSSTGKTRACWEAVQPLAGQDWRLWHPFDPTRASAALKDLRRVGPRTVVWLNEAQHYLGAPDVGEEIASALHSLLTAPERGPVLILGTLWPDYERQYTGLPPVGGPDPHSRVKELLAGQTVATPDCFDAEALRAAQDLADEGDGLLADALTRAWQDGRVTQDLAGASQLLKAYQLGSPAARALLETAMDARRLGVGPHLPQAFLTDAVPDYLTDSEYDQLTDDWAETAFAELARPVHGRQVPLRRARARSTRCPPGTPSPTPASLGPSAGPVFRLADYLEQQGRTTRGDQCPPASFWDAATRHLSQHSDLRNVAVGASHRARKQWQHHILHLAAEAGSDDAMIQLAWWCEEREHFAAAEALYEQAAEAGNTVAVRGLAQRRLEAGDRSSAEALYRTAAEAGDFHAARSLMQIRLEASDQAGAEAAMQTALDAGYDSALLDLAAIRRTAGDTATAEALDRQASESDDFRLVAQLAAMQAENGDLARAESLYRRAGELGNGQAWLAAGTLRQAVGDLLGACAYYRLTIDFHDPYVRIQASSLLMRAGDGEGAQAMIDTLVAGQGHAELLMALGTWCQEAGDHQAAAEHFEKAIRLGSVVAMVALANLQEHLGKPNQATDLYRQAADRGTLVSDWPWWPYGLNPDGSEADPWTCLRCAPTP